MKALLTKTTRPFLIYVLIVLGISVPVYYVIIDNIWKSELDEHNQIITDQTSFALNRLNLSDEELSTGIDLWNKIQPGTNIHLPTPDDALEKRIYTIEKQKTYDQQVNIDRFRCLSTIIYIKNKPYRFTIETNIEESQETIAAIAATTLFFFLILVIGLIYLTRKLSHTVWKPFQDSVEKLKTFNLNHQTNITFAPTDTLEFHELNQSLNKLISQNISVYKNQKEFTENASHELQTPLAILKNKLDILLQNKDLTIDQYEIAEDMHRALSRSARINKNLLLLAKIDNSQFDNSEYLILDTLVLQTIATLQEHVEQKDINLELNIHENVHVNGNNSLTEILINNLLLNAIRHTPTKGIIVVTLTDSRFEIANTGAKTLDSDSLFKRFSKLSKETNGSGLGLAIVSEICRHQNWTVSYSFKNNMHIFSLHF